MSLKVLMVEDEELTREGLYRCIPWESLGITQVDMAEDGEEGLRKALELQPDIVMADVRMPRMDGITMAFEIRKKLRSCRFIFISGYCDKELATLQGVYTQYGPLLDLGLAEDVEKTLEEFNKQAEAAGLQKIMDELKAQPKVYFENTK